MPAVTVIVIIAIVLAGAALVVSAVTLVSLDELKKTLTPRPDKIALSVVETEITDDGTRYTLTDGERTFYITL